MIASLIGTVETMTDVGVVLNVNGVGFDVHTGNDTMQILSAKAKDEAVHLYTYLNVGREGSLTLYGFLSKEELRMFKMLISVSGIGPKGALSILSSIGVEDLVFAISSGDTKSLTKVPGIGKKTADRLILDLRDKLSLEDWVKQEGPTLEGAALGNEGEEFPGLSGSMESAAKDAAEALTSLGYNRMEAVKAVRKAKSDLTTAQNLGEVTNQDITELLLKGALQYLG